MAHFCLIYSRDHNLDAEHWMTCRQIFSSPGFETISRSITELPPQNLSANFFLQIPSSFHILHFFAFQRCLIDARHYWTRPVFPLLPIMIPLVVPLPLSTTVKNPLWWCDTTQTEKNHEHKIYRTQQCSHQFGRPSMLTLWEKYAGLKLKTKGSFCS